MSTVKVIFDEKRLTKSGEIPIWIRLIKDRKPKYISLGIKVLQKDWNYKTSRVRASHPNSARINNLIAQKVADAEGVLLDLEISKKQITPRKAKDAVLGRSSESFLKYAEKHITSLENAGKIGTQLKYRVVIDKLIEYLGKKDLIFDEITVSFLKDYEEHLRVKKTNGVNTIHSNLKAIRKLVNDAVKEDILDMNKNPFLRFKLKTENSEKSFLTEAELKLLEDFKFDSKLNMMGHHRNMYVFAAYTGGLRISDIILLKWENYDGERLILKVNKTDTTLSIIVPDKARVILSLYYKEDNKPSDYIFPCLKSGNDYSDAKVLHRAISSATAYANKDLGTIADSLELDKKMNFHTSRHTFATRALRKGMRIEYVSKLMAHSNIKTTQIYAKIVNEELDNAMKIFND